MELRWYVTNRQTRKDGPYQTSRTLQFRPSSNYEWVDVEEEYAPEVRFDDEGRK